ncbi:MAG: oligosaccharide flippase family protein [Pirellulales bacterium]
MFRRIAINTASSFGFRAFSLVLSFISVPVLVGTVGADGFGLILLALSVMGYFNLLNAGVPAGTVKYIAEFEAKGDRTMVDQVIASSFTFFLFAGVLVMAMVAGFAALGGLALFQIDPEKQEAGTRLLYVASVLALITWPLGTFGQVLEGLQRYPENKLAIAVGDVINKGAAIVFALAGAPIEIIFLMMNIGLLVTVPLQLRMLRRGLFGWRLRLTDFRWSTLRMIFGYSLWAMLGQVAYLLIFQTDRIILALFLPIAALTIYHVVTMPFLAIADLSALYRSALTPAVSAAGAKRGRAGLDMFIYTLSRYSNAFIAPLAIIGAFLSGPFIVLWMGEEYLPYVWIAQVACIFQLLWQSTTILGTVFMGTGKIKRITLIALTLAILNVPLGVWWVQLIGVAGVVFSTVFVGVLAIPLEYLIAMPELEMDRKRYFLQSFLGGQWTSWLLGLVLLPAAAAMQSITTWSGLAAVALALTVLFYGANWFLSVEKRHREMVWRCVPLFNR